jgi:RNA polymerase sigma factor (sigma-70 family)
VLGTLPERVGTHAEPEIVDRLVLRQALMKLPVRQRTVIVLRYYEARSEDEIAEVLGCRPGTVKSHAARAIARMRELLPDLPDLYREGVAR